MVTDDVRAVAVHLHDRNSVILATSCLPHRAQASLVEDCSRDGDLLGQNSTDDFLGFIDAIYGA